VTPSLFRSRRRSIAGLLGLALFACLAGPGASAEAAPKPDLSIDMAVALAPGPLPDLTMGDAKGVPVVEYGSATCPHCAHFARDVFPAFKKAYVDTGKVRFIFREYSRNDLDIGAFMLARCLGDDKAYSSIELLFASQDSWAFGKDPLEGLLKALQPTGLTPDKATACLNDQARANAFVAIVKTADDKFKISGTPSFIIDGNVYGGVLSLDELNTILKPLIK